MLKTLRSDTRYAKAQLNPKPALAPTPAPAPAPEEIRTFDDFGDLIFERIVDGDQKTLWRLSREKSVPICRRSDMTAFLAKLELVDKESGMYPLWERISEVTILCVAVGVPDDVPDPYYVEEDGKWIKSPAAAQWNAPDVEYQLFDSHSIPPTGLDSLVW